MIYVEDFGEDMSIIKKIMEFARVHIASFYVSFSVKYRKNYVKKKLKKRKGNCSKCGECCKNRIYGVKCIYLNDKNLCSIYDDRMKICRAFPIDVLSIRLARLEGKCSYYWDKNE